MPRYRALALALIALLCLGALPSTAVPTHRVDRSPTLSAADTTPPVLRYRLDLDGDRLPDELVLRPSSDWDDSGTYNRLEVALSRSGRHILTGAWDPPDTVAYPRRGNLVASSALLVGHFPRAGTLLFLFGRDVGCCFQSIHIYRVTAHGISNYFHRSEFLFTEPLNLSSSTAATIVGLQGRSEATGTTAPGAPSGWTYNPHLVLRLEERARIDTAATAARTRAIDGGFAGVNPRNDVFVITNPDSSHYLWDNVHRRRIP